MAPSREDFYAVTELAATLFRRHLREDLRRRYALDDLGRSGLVASDASASWGAYDPIESFRIGYAPPHNGLSTYSPARPTWLAAAKEVGLLTSRSTPDRFHDRFRDRLMFPVVDTIGRTVGFIGRSIAPRPGEIPIPPWRPPPRYLASHESRIYEKREQVFGLYQARGAMKAEGLAIVVEGILDVVFLAAHGVRNVVSPLGAAFTPEHARLLAPAAARLVFVFDGDAAGRRASSKARAVCRNAGFASSVVTLPEGLDAGAFAREKGLGKLRAMVREAARGS